MDGLDVGGFVKYDNVGFNAWGDQIDAGGAILPSSIESNSQATLPAGFSQSPNTTSSASTSWLGGSVPQIAKDALAAVQTGFGLSLAKDQLLANRDITKATLANQLALTQGQGLLQRYQLAGAASQAALAAQYPLGLPIGSTRSDQIMIMLAVAAIAVVFISKNK